MTSSLPRTIVGGYPVVLDVSGRSCAVVGGGTVARRRVAGLLEAGALVKVVAPEVDPAIRSAGQAEIIARPFEPADLDGCYLAVAATDHPQVNQLVVAAARARGVLVSASDAPTSGDFAVPARIRRGPLLVTVSSGGASPAVTRFLRRQLEESLGPEYGVLVELAEEVRGEVLSGGSAPSAELWERALDSELLASIRSGRIAEAKERLLACLSSSSD